MSARTLKLIPAPRLLLALLALIVGLAGCSADDPLMQPPLITVDVRSEESYIVGQDIIQIHITATDPQGGPVQLKIADKPERAQFQSYQNSATFTWDPIASDVTGDTPRRLIFAATSNTGQTTERVVNVRIRAGNGLPRFLNSASELYDPASGQPLVIEVRVRDDDSRRVLMEMPAHLAPEGAEFEQISDLEARFSWMPTPLQASKRVHSVVFIGDDEDNTPVEHKVTIIIKQKDSGTVDVDPTSDTCLAEDTITHSALKAQRTHKGYAVDATLSAAGAARYTSVYMYWTLDDALNGGDARYHAEEMAKDGALYRAVIPNQLLEPGTAKTIFYSICAYDDDADDDDELAVICAPTSVSYSFIAYSPDENDCIDDVTRNDSPANAAAISRERWNHFRACSARDDYHKIEVQGGEKVDVYVLFSKGSELTPSLKNAQQQDVAMKRSACTGYAWARIEIAEGQPAQSYVLRVGGNDQAYQVTAFAEGVQGCAGQQYEPNNTPAQATLVSPGYTAFDDMAICEPLDKDIFTFELVKGDSVWAELWFSHAKGDLDMTLYGPSQLAQVLGEGSGVAQGWSNDDNEELLYSATESGFHYLMIETADTANGYELDIETACGDRDRYAGNHTRALASPIGLDEHRDLKLCPGQPDWFLRQGFTGTTILGELTVQHGRASDVKLEVYNDANVRVAQASERNGRLELEFEPAANASYFYKVESTRSSIYSLTLYQF
ncbi:MAG: PPC domain-containing protein [Bradymonadaceae bacterium]|nr:PPC domain-containing protein [Lujinxingiaceae bacterium]